MIKSFIHDSPEFDSLLTIVATHQGIPVALIEKDYWVTHTLWSLENQGLKVMFKGGTSLSKGFGLIERFSEDLDVKLEAPDLPEVSNWRSEGVKATRARQGFFKALQGRLRVPGADIEELNEYRDPHWRNVVFAVHYPSRLTRQLPPGVRPFVQLEVGSARVTPGEVREITSWVHDYLNKEVQEVAESSIDNRPSAVHCVLPQVTCLEKIEAVSRRCRRTPFEPGTFVRHYEDIARILESGLLPSLELLDEMKASGDIRAWPKMADPSFNSGAENERWEQLESSWAELQSLFWGPRVPLEECARAIRELVNALCS